MRHIQKDSLIKNWCYGIMTAYMEKETIMSDEVERQSLYEYKYVV